MTRFGEEHTLTIFEWTNEDGSIERDWEVHHPDSCEQVLDSLSFHFDNGEIVEEVPLITYACSMQNELHHCGLDCLDPEWTTLEPGQYRIRTWFEHTPSLPTNGGEEWDSGIELVDSVPQI